jgi:hypothetical protein
VSAQVELFRSITTAFQSICNGEQATASPAALVGGAQSTTASAKDRNVPNSAAGGSRSNSGSSTSTSKTASAAGVSAAAAAAPAMPSKPTRAVRSNTDDAAADDDKANAPAVPSKKGVHKAVANSVLSGEHPLDNAEVQKAYASFDMLGASVI